MICCCTSTGVERSQRKKSICELSVNNRKNILPSTSSGFIYIVEKDSIGLREAQREKGNKNKAPLAKTSQEMSEKLSVSTNGSKGEEILRPDWQKGSTIQFVHIICGPDLKKLLCCVWLIQLQTTSAFWQINSFKTVCRALSICCVSPHSSSVKSLRITVWHEMIGRANEDEEKKHIYITHDVLIL